MKLLLFRSQNIFISRLILIYLTLIFVIVVIIIHVYAVRLESKSMIMFTKTSSFRSNGFDIKKENAVIFRIIGNDLPPRHSPMQHETAFSGVKKIWILNRIVDDKKLQALISILKEHNREYYVIPFDINYYSKIPLDTSAFPVEDYFYSEEFSRLSFYEKNAAIDQLYHQKNLYVMNNNGARNFAIEEGKKYARWIFALDGNSFFTDTGWSRIESCLKNENITVIQIPMVRLVDNYEALQKSFIPTVVEEPQLAFRQDSNLKFNPDYRYGRRSKIELLWRLNIPGPWNNSKKFFPWEDGFSASGLSDEKWISCGWVARLFSGRQEQEWKDASSIRNYNRIIGIHSLIDSLDRQLIEKHVKAKGNFMILSKNNLNYLKNLMKQSSLPAQILKVWTGASLMVARHHPMLDFQFNTGQISLMDRSMAVNILSKFQKRLYFDALLSYITDADNVAYEAYQLAWNWLLKDDSDTKSRSNLFEKIFEHAKFSWSNLTDIRNNFNFVMLFDALTILEESSLIGFYDYDSLRNWAETITEKMKTFDYQQSTIYERNVKDIQITAACIFAKDYICAYHSISRVSERNLKVNDLQDETMSVGCILEKYIGLQFQEYPYLLRKNQQSHLNYNNIGSILKEFLEDLPNDESRSPIDDFLTKVSKYNMNEAYKIIEAFFMDRY